MKYLIILLIISSIFADEFKGIKVINIDRRIDTATHIVEFTNSYKFETTTPQKEFVFGLTKEQSEFLAIITATDEDNKELDVKKLDTKTKYKYILLNSGEYVYYAVVFPKEIESGKTVVVDIEGKILHQLHPYPKEIKQNDRQFVVYRDSAYAIVPYPCESQVTEIDVDTSSIEGYTEIEPAKSQSKVVKYGPYKNIAANTFEPIKVHFLNASPFKTATRILKEVEVSLWGNVAIEEIYSVEHSGAKLKGPFSRLDYDMNKMANSADWIMLEGDIPLTATDAYYRDVIGNISSSFLRKESTKQHFELQMRFPMFGGWKNEFYLGYNLPISHYVTHDGNRHTLKVKFGPAMKDLAIDNYIIRFILPEGAKDVKYSYKYPLKREKDEKRFTYLDSNLEGRPVIQFDKNNVVDDYDKFIEISYTLTLSVWREPFMIIGSFFAIFLCASIVRFIS